MRDFLLFKRMLMPWLLQAFFWIASIVCIVAGFYAMFHGGNVLSSLRTIIIGPLLIRILCEWLVLPFCINETLTDVKARLAKMDRLSVSESDR